MEDSHHFISVPCEEGPFDVLCGRRPDSPAAKERRASRTTVSERAVARETGTIGRGFLLATSSTRGGG